MAEKVALTCQWCLGPFVAEIKLSGRPRDSIEYEPLRKALFIADATHEPVICDGCFAGVMSSAPPPERVGAVFGPLRVVTAA